MEDIVILGAGFAGFGAAYRLNDQGVKSKIYEKKVYHGGNCASYQHDGFTYDAGPHVSFTSVTRLQELFAKSIDYKYEEVKAQVNNYWQGQWIKHPAQCNLYGLPKALKEDILVDFIKACKNRENVRVENYKNWLYAAFGRTFAENFPMEYTKRFHTTTADNMTTDWIGPRLYQPEIREVMHGALYPKTDDVHYVTMFRYPSYNGFVSYLNSFLKNSACLLEHEVVNIDPKEKKITFKNNKTVSYGSLVSSIPLPELIPMISGVPEDVHEAAIRLACSTCVLVNIGINREDISETHWSYFYDQDFIFTRLSFPHMQSLNNVPKGAGCIQAEVYYSKKYRPVDRAPESCIDPVIKDLRRCGLIRDGDKIMYSNAMVMPYANIIFDLDRPAALETVHGYLKDIGIEWCGRYGEWGYLWSDQSFISGEEAAQRALDRITSG